MKRFLHITLLLSCMAFISHGQSSADNSTPKPKKISRVGLQVGMNFPTMVFTKISDQTIYPEFETFTRVNAGIYSESGATDNFVFHIGLFYSGAGYKTEFETLTLDYVQVPMVFNFRTDLYEELFLTLGGGFYGGFAFAGKSETDDEINRDILSMKDADNTKPFYYIDAGLLLKADFEYTFQERKVVKLGVSYNFGVINASNEISEDLGGGNTFTYDLGAKNRIFSVNLTYLINLKKDKEPVDL